MQENGIGDSDVAVCIPTDISDGGDDKSPEIGSKAQTCLVCSRVMCVCIFLFSVLFCLWCRVIER